MDEEVTGTWLAEARDYRNDGNGAAVEKKSINVRYHAYIVLSHHHPPISRRATRLRIPTIPIDITITLILAVWIPIRIPRLFLDVREICFGDTLIISSCVFLGMIA